jgi:septin family protein
LGKSSFINTLLDREVIPLDSLGIARKTLDFTAYHDELSSGNHTVEITIWDTPGYGDDVYLYRTWGRIASFIEEKSRQYHKNKMTKARDGKFDQGKS